MPKTAALNPGDPATAHVSPEEALEREAKSNQGPTAQQLVALLSRRMIHTREQHAPTPMEPYKARPISFAASPWDVVKLWVAAHRLRVSLGGAALVLMLSTVCLLKLASLNADIDRQWLGVEAALRQRYAPAPAYLECIASYSTTERYTVAVTEQALRNWRSAHTEKEVVAAAARMESVLTLLAKVMKHYDQNGVAKEDEQIESSTRFVHLEQQRERSRAVLGEKIPAYNQAVEDFNDKVLGVPGSWIAWLAGLHARLPFYASGRAP